MKTIKKFALSSLFGLIAASTNYPCLANQFPGTGSEEAWRQACDLSNQGNALLKSGQHSLGLALLHKAIEIYPAILKITR